MRQVVNGKGHQRIVPRFEELAQFAFELQNVNVGGMDLLLSNAMQTKFFKVDYCSVPHLARRNVAGFLYLTPITRI